jgi:cytoskeleton protein RodZ
MATPNSSPSGTEGGKPLSEERSLTVGQYLRQEREKKNISLEAVAKVTRITQENLEALERDDFRAISASVFARGFLRTYASFLGLDPKEVLSRYESQVDLLKISPKIKESTPSENGNPLFKYVVFLSLIVIGVAIGYYFFQKAPSPPAQPPPLATVPPPPIPTVQPPPPPPPPSPPPPEIASHEAVPEKEKKPTEKLLAAAPITKEEEKPKERRHILKVVTTEKTWLRIKPDDQPLIDVLLQPKETVSWSARRRFDITIGNAGGVEIFFNGVSQGNLGKPGEVINLVLPKEAGPFKAPVPKETKPSEPVTQKDSKPSTDVVPKGTKPSAEVAPKEPEPAKDVSANEPKNEPQSTVGEKENPKN